MAEHRVTIRLPNDLYAQLAARGSQGLSLAAIVRQALVDYLARQPEDLTSLTELEEMLAAVAARVADLHEQVQQLTARVDAMAATWQLMAASEVFPAAERQPLAANEPQEPAPPVAAVAASGQPTAAPRRPGRPSGPLRQQILDLLQDHPEGLSAEAIRVHVQARRPIGDTLQGMVKSGVIVAQGSRARRRYVLGLLPS
jgi:hypothetical protein